MASPCTWCPHKAPSNKKAPRRRLVWALSNVCGWQQYPACFRVGAKKTRCAQSRFRCVWCYTCQAYNGPARQGCGVRPDCGSGRPRCKALRQRALLGGVHGQRHGKVSERVTALQGGAHGQRHGRLRPYLSGAKLSGVHSLGLNAHHGAGPYGLGITLHRAHGRCTLATFQACNDALRGAHTLGYISLCQSCAGARCNQFGGAIANSSACAS